MEINKKKLLEKETQEHAAMGLDSDHSSDGQTLLPNLNNDNDLTHDRDRKSDQRADSDGHGLIGGSPMEDK